MCRRGIDDADRTFEEESRRHNQRALSASNGLALDASGVQMRQGGGMEGTGLEGGGRKSAFQRGGTRRIWVRAKGAGG